MDIFNIFNNNNNNNNDNQINIKYKYLLLGDSLITLNKIIKLFTEGSYNQDQLEITVSSSLPQLSYREGTFNNKLVRMEVIFDSRITRDIIYTIDTNIQEFFNCFNAFIIVYDTTDLDSFNNLVDWIDIINQFTSNGSSNGSSNIFLVGDNCNNRSERKVSIEQGRNFAIKNQCCGFIEISTRDNKNIENIFIELTNILINQIDSHQHQQQQQQSYTPPKLSPIPKDSVLDSLFKVSVITASIFGLIYFLKSK